MAVARDALPFALLGAAPDLDLLVGLHSQYTHSIGAAALIGLILWVVVRSGRAQPGSGQDRRPAAFALACAAAVGSHVLLDWLGSDTTPPIGIMALWPFSGAYYQSDLHVFGAVSRRYWQSEFYVRNGLVALREIAILVPVLWIVGRRRTAR